MRILTAFIVLIGLALPAAPLQAQESVHLRVLDSASGVPIRRAHAYVTRVVSARGDSAGRIRLDSVPAAARGILVFCRPTTGFRSSAVDDGRGVRLPVPPGERQGDTIVVRMDGARCDQRATPDTVVTLLGVIQNHHHGTTFFPCPASIRALPPALRTIAAEPRGLPLVSIPGPWRDIPLDAPMDTTRATRDTRWYGRLEGILAGPGRYGPRGGDPYQLELSGGSKQTTRRPAACD
jgi:hypothetical protein